MFAIRHRFRWWQWLVAAVVLLGGVRVAWHFRPLNAMERRLIGTWDIRNHQWDGFMTFTEDRRFAFRFRGRSPEAGWEIPDMVGSWSVRGKSLYYTYDSPTRDPWSYLKREWVLLTNGKSRTTSISRDLIAATSEEDRPSRKSTDPPVEVVLRPVSAVDRAMLGLPATSTRRD